VARKRPGTGNRGPGTGEGRSGALRVAFSWRMHPGGRPTAALRRLAERALARLGLTTAEVGVLVCDDATIRGLNRRYRHKDTPTDVLSFEDGFAQPDGVPYLGDVAISLETARRQADEADVPLVRELELLLLHALVHLKGYDHESDEGEMTALEAELRRELLP
jgi:probable rRNA maturation factor